MSEHEIQTEIPDSKEIVIELDPQSGIPKGESKETPQDNSQNNPQDSLLTNPVGKTPPSNSQKELRTANYVQKKLIKDLTEDERALIISNAKSGIDQPYFDVKWSAKGNPRIVKKKFEPPTTSQKVLSHSDAQENLSQISKEKTYYTDNQLLFEHIIELNSKIDKLFAKHKKLKRKYQTLQSDIYLDESDFENKNDLEEGIQPTAPQHSIDLQTKVPEENEEPIVNSNPSSNSYVQPVQRVSWRSRLTYL